MKYLSKQNAGVYIPLILFGGGVGLLVGSYIATKLQQRLELEDYPEEDTNHDETCTQTDEGPLETGDDGGEGTGQKGSSARKSRGRFVPDSRRTGPRTTYPDEPLDPNGADIETPPWEDYRGLAEYEEGELTESDMMIDDDFEDFDQLPDPDDEFDESATNWPITLTDPFIETPSVGGKRTRLIYDVITERLVKHSNGRETPVKNIESTLGPDTLEDVIEILETQDVPHVYVYDCDGDKLYTVELRDAPKKPVKPAAKPRAQKRKVVQSEMTDMDDEGDD